MFLKGKIFPPKEICETRVTLLEVYELELKM